MPVTTINLDDFLVQKNSGDIVTGADWNKLVALFHAVNGNANTLLDLIKAVDVNTANIAQVSQGAVPDGSIDYAKLSKLGGTTNRYVLTSDPTPNEGITYYTLEGTKYIPHTDLIDFESGVQYYTLETVPTVASIAGPDVVGDGVIEDYHLADHTLLPRACSEFLLGGLLNDNATVYTDKGVSGTLKAGDTCDVVEHSITLDKEHKAVIIIGSTSLILLTADVNKPNLFIGHHVVNYGSSGTLGPGGSYIKPLVGASKEKAPQTTYSPGGNWEGYCVGVEPAGLLTRGLAHMQLLKCTYDYITKTITIKICNTTNRSYKYPAESYSFGGLIIGL